MSVYRLGYLDSPDGESQEQNQEAIEKIIKQEFGYEVGKINIEFSLQGKSAFYIAAAMVAKSTGVKDAETLDKFISNHSSKFPKPEDARFALVRYMEFIN